MILHACRLPDRGVQSSLLSRAFRFADSILLAASRLPSIALAASVKILPRKLQRDQHMKNPGSDDPQVAGPRLKKNGLNDRRGGMKVVLALTGLGIAAASAMAFSSATQVHPRPHMAPPVIAPGKPFVDDLSRLDKAIWSVSGGWSNGSYMVNDWRRSQSVFDDGLVLTLEDLPGGISRYASGEVQSRTTYGHGYYEATMQAASGSGIVSGFFTYTGPPFGKPWNEIDVEILGKDTKAATLTYHNNGKSISHVVELDFDAASGLHHYAFDWQPGYIRWYIDGKLVREEVGSELPLPNEAQKIMMHLWGTDSNRDWTGPFDKGAVPTSMRFGCIAYSYSRPATDQCRGGKDR